MTRWAYAYRPLRPRALGVQLVVLVVAEVVLFTSYQGHDAGFHWSTHFLVALIAWSLLNLGWLAVKAAPARGQLVTLLALHVYAVIPDLLFFARVDPHEDWMDVFLGHLSVHYIPGGDETWLALALGASAAYAGALAMWLRARHLEAEAGMAPGVGIGGTSILRPQADPSRTLLHHHLIGTRRPPDMVLLHGLTASTQVWEPAARRLAERGHGVLVCDLLGFGCSRTVGTTFDLDAQADAVARLLRHHEAQPVTVVGHSWGCAVAARLAERHRALTAELVLISPPVFHDPEQARERLGRRGWLARQVLRQTPIASAVCGTMCLARGALQDVAPRVVRDVPRPVLRDSFEHSWPAYRDAILSLFDGNPLPQALRAPAVPTRVLLADDDQQTPPGDVLDHPHAVAVEVLRGDHLMPIRNPDAVAEAIS